MPFNAFSNPDNMIVSGQLTVQHSKRLGNTGVSFDDGLIVSDGLGNLIANSFTGTGTGGALTVANVVGYGADPTGVKDSTVFINNAIAAVALLGGGIVFFPFGTYKVSSTLIINSDNVELIGSGWGSVLSATNTFSATPMVHVLSPGNSTHRYGIKIADIFLNGNSVSGVGGIKLDNTYNAQVHHTRIRFCPGIGIDLEGGGAVGAYTGIFNCNITDGGAGTGILTNSSEAITVYGGLIAWYNTAGGTGIKLTNGSNMITNVTFDECDTAFWDFFGNANQVIGCQFTRGLTQFMYLNGTKYTSIQNNYMSNFAGTGSKAMIQVDNAFNASNIISNNIALPGTGWTYFVHELGDTGTPANLYIGNNMADLSVIRHSGVFRSNYNYNPAGPLTAPTIPASTVAQTNTFGVDCTVFVNGGTVTVVAIGGTATGQTSGPFRVPAGQTITLTYSVVPTSWTWFGD